MELNAALLWLDGESVVRIIILKGAGKAFCVGIDVGDYFGKSTMEYREWITCMETPLETISRMKKPVMEGGAPVLLRPMVRAMDRLLYRELLKAPAALDMGLINKVMPADDLEMEARRCGVRAGRQEPCGRSERQVGFLCRRRPEL